jgi:predicted nucleotidyltransferase
MYIDLWILQLRQHLPELRHRYGVRQLWLFGPHAHGKGTPAMPLDILADVEGALSYAEFLELQELLGQWLGIQVELVLKGQLDPSVAEIVIPEMIAVAPQ